MGDVLTLMDLLEMIQHLERRIVALEAQTPRRPAPTPKARPTLGEVQIYCAKAGISPGDAEWFWNKMEGCGWKNAGKAVLSWQRTLIAWKLAGYLASQRQNSGNVHANPVQVRSWAARQADALERQMLSNNQQ